MSFKANQTPQLTLTDSFVNLSPRTQRIVMNSWCKDFADIVFLPLMKSDFLFYIAVTNFHARIHLL